MHDKLDEASNSQARLSLKQPSFFTQAVTLVCLWFSFKATRISSSIYAGTQLLLPENIM